MENYKRINVMLFLLAFFFCLTTFSLLPDTAPEQSIEETPKKASNNYNEYTDSLIYGMGNVLSDLDPHNAWDSASFDVIDQVAEGLFGYNLSDPELGIIPRLASAMGTWSHDNLNYTVSLKEGVMFHDGSPFNATAVNSSFTRLAYFMNISGTLPASTKETQLNDLYRWEDYTPIINRTEVIDLSTIKFVLNRPSMAFPALLCFPGSYILSTMSTNQTGYLNNTTDDLVGTGPFVYDKHIEDTNVTFHAFNDYWADPPSITNLTFSIITDTDARNQALLDGDIHFIDGPSSSYLSDFEDDPYITVTDSINRLTIQYLGMNNRQINVTWRHAISHAINYSFLLKDIVGDQGSRLKSPIPEGMLYANWSFDVANFDVTKAREILQNNMSLGVGFTTENDWLDRANTNPFLSLNITYNIGNTYRENVSDLVKDNLARIGINVTIEGMTWQEFLNKAFDIGGENRDMLQLFAFGWIPDFNDPSNFVDELMSNQSISNTAQINDPLIQTWMEEAHNISDPLLREAHYDKIQKRCVEDLRPWAYFYVPSLPEAYSSGFTGFQANPMDLVWFHSVSSTKIYINGSATGVGAYNWTWAINQPWCSGAGTKLDPYVIENLTINAVNSGSCIKICDSEKYFIIQNCTLSRSGSDLIDAGITLDNASNGIIINNSLIDNYGVGVFLSQESNNTNLHNNYFLENVISAQDNGTKNVWYNESITIGNYWSDYGGEDYDENGIGDDPYYIEGSAGSFDLYPIWNVGRHHCHPEVLIYGVAYGPSYIDSMQAWDSASIEVISQAAEGLFRYNISDPDLPIIPHLALSGSWDPTFTNYTCSLRQGVQFHDGASFNASSVKWNFDRIYTNIGQILPAELYLFPNGTQIVNSTQVVSDYEVKFVLNGKYAPFQALLCFSGSYMLSPVSTPYNEIIDTYSGDLVGTGPFVFDKYEIDDRVVFHGYENYWEGAPSIKKLIFRIIPDNNERNLALLNGDIDFIDSPLFSYLDNFTKDPTTTVTAQQSKTTINYIGMNNKHINVTWRHVISYAINYSHIIDAIMEGQATRLRSPVPDGILYANSSFNVADFNVTKARLILQNNMSLGTGLDPNNDADWETLTDTTPFMTFNFTYNIGNFARENVFMLVKQNLRKIGVNVTDAGMSWGEFLNRLYESDGCHRDMLELFMIGWTPDYNDPSNFINPLMTNRSIASNGAQVNDSLLQLWMEQAVEETDPFAREALYDNIQKRCVEELMPWVFLYVPYRSNCYRSDFTGFVPNPMDIVRFYNVSSTKVYINGEENTWAWALTQPWCSGTGTKLDPYVIENLTINAAGSGSGIRIENTDKFFIINNCTISYSGVKWLDAAITIDNSSNGKILNCNLTNNGLHGIYLTQCANVKITKNNITSNAENGIYLNPCDNVSITENNVTNNINDGIYLLKSNNSHIDNNNIKNNKFNGIFLNTSNNNNITSNFLDNNSLHGIFLNTACDNNMISGNCFYNLTYGIWLATGSDNNTIKGNTLDFNSWAINSQDCSKNSILGNNASNNELGILLNNNDNATVLENNVSNNVYGVYVNYSDNNTISNNAANHNTKSGIYLSNCDHIWLLENTVDQNYECGIEVNHSNFLYFSGNSVQNNTYSGTYIFKCEQVDLVGNTANLNSHCGIALNNSKYVTITGNTGDNNSWYGISLELSNHTTISKNNVSNNKITGVLIWNSNNNTILENKANNNTESGFGIVADRWTSDNTLYMNIANNNSEYGIGGNMSKYLNLTENSLNFNGKYGIGIGLSNDSIVTRNIVFKNEGGGIGLSVCYNFSINMNNASNNNVKGIAITDTNNTKILNCNATDNQYGLYINPSSSNVISGNTFRENYEFGVYVNNSFSQNNLFYNNYFFSNQISAEDSGTNNYWNNSAIGNFWSDYTGSDQNGDGIGDTPYNLNGVIDYLPIYADGDSDKPILTINLPIDGAHFNSTPWINVTALDANLRDIWFSNGTLSVMLANGVAQRLNESIWESISGESEFKLYIYADDYFGNTETKVLTLYKDIRAPTITLYAPNDYDLFQNTPPSIEVNISDTYLKSMRFTIENESGIVLSDTWTGQITQEQWDSVENGVITINFFADDYAGNQAQQSVLVRKSSAVLIEGDTAWTFLSEQGFCEGSGTYSDPYIIEDVYLDGNNDGSSFEIKDSNVYFTISNCTFTNSGSGFYDAGISMNNVSNGQLFNCNCSNNNGNGMFLNRCTNVSITNNLVSNNGYMGIFLKDSEDNLLSENTANDNGMYGIYIDPSNNNRITGNTASNNDYGIFLNSSSTNVLQENIVSFNNYDGICLEECYYNIISENIAINNSGNGIHLIGSNDNTLSRNNVDFNSIYGIYLHDSHDNTLSWNHVDNNPVGIYLDNSNYNSVTNNQLTDNQEGIVENNCIENVIENNEDNSPIPINAALIWMVAVPIMAVISGGAVLVKRKTIYHLIKPKDKVRKPKFKKKFPVEYEEKILTEEELAVEAETSTSKYPEKIFREEKLPVKAKVSTKKLLVSKPKAIEVAKPKKIKKLEKEIPSEYIMTPAEIAEARKVESEVDVEEQKIMCVVHRGAIDGNIYTCPKCRSFYCIRCAYVLIDKGENCWVCEEKFMLKKPEIQMYDDVLMERVEVEGPRMIFLSYSTLDSEHFNIPLIAERLEEFPEINKVLFWEVDSGESVVDFMEETLRISNVFMLFCTENSLNSEAVKGEWQAAYQLRKRGKMKIVPVFEKEEDVPLLLLPLISVKFVKEEFEKFIEDLYKEIMR